MARRLSFAAAVNEAQAQAMELDDSVICFGLGADDPKGIFGTTTGLVERFGPHRVFDMPASENAMTGVGIGAALNGMRPVMTHQRMDFFLLALDQLVNNGAKWHYMFGRGVPVTIRLIVGRGWGQGPTHSQSLQSWLTHVPGLKVVMPSRARDAKGLLLESIFDDNPVVVLEHRWLYGIEDEVDEAPFGIPLGQGERLREGEDVTLVAASHMTVEALKAWEYLAAAGVHCDLIDLKSLSPLDWDLVFDSVGKTGRVLVLDTGWAQGSVAGEIIARIAMDCHGDLKTAPRRLALPDYSVPTAFELTRNFYPHWRDIVAAVAEMTGSPMAMPDRTEILPHDVPDPEFNGPF